MSAYDCYLKGRDHFYRHGDADFETAESLYMKAIELDPWLAIAYTNLGNIAFRRQDAEQAQAAQPTDD